MTGKLRFLPCASIFALSFAFLGCSDPGSFDAAPHPPDAGVIELPEVCEASEDWLPNTPELPMFLPIPHPAGECPFYRSGWQNFLRAMQPDPVTGHPALQDNYLTIDDVFTSYTPHAKQGTLNRAWLGDIKQAGLREILIDQNGRSLYYGIHMNQAFADFVKANHLETPKGIQDAIANPNANLFFPEGLVEFKSAWQEVIDPNDPDLANWITTKAWVPHLSQKITTDPMTNKVTKEMEEDKDHPREIMVRLLAIHVVSTLPGHPEFIWASFEHSSGTPDTGSFSGFRDVAPNTGANPTDGDPFNLDNHEVPSMAQHVLYTPGTEASQGNKSIAEDNLDFDEINQKFNNPPTSIYRMFPASKSNTIDPDNAITSLNHNVELLFKQNPGKIAANDKRGHYRLLGAQWMDKPYFFENNITIQNTIASSKLINKPDGFPEELVSQGNERADLLKGKDPAQSVEEFAFGQIRADGSDSPFSILAGEDRMSSTAMESFTQSTSAFPNCFSCHNTTAVTSNGVPAKPNDTSVVVLLQPSLLNVSHIFSQVILEQCTTPEQIHIIAGVPTAVCK